ncbi:MAG: hypothetical protein OXU36_10165 [Candidatus Poribacteria bacterium]|nr:hypothetical protein [Candidatus Poribacteria bacterium]
MGIIEWLNANAGAIIGIATVVLAGITGYYAYLTRRLLKANDTPVYEIAKAIKKIQEDSHHVTAGSVGNNQQLSHKEFKAALEEWDALVKKFAKPDTEPLSDYATSRESIYENHPKL